LNGRHGLSPARGHAVAAALGLSGQMSELFVNLVTAHHGRDPRTKKSAEKRVQRDLSQLDFYRLSEDSWQLIADWYYFAILELTKLSSCDSSHSYFSKALGLPQQVVSDAIARLLRSNLLKRAKGRLVATNANVAVGDSGMPNDAIRLGHKQTLERAIHAIYNQNLEQRHFSSINFVMSRDALPRAKELIRNFRRELAAEVRKFPAADRVYTLSVQLFDLCPDLE
jgi:uncharacterized protein (TIGR02147 family)